MLREVPMRMYSSLEERIDFLREENLTPDVSTDFQPPCWSPLGGLQQGVSILNTIILPNSSSSEYRTSPKPWHAVYLLLLYDILIS